MTVRFWGVRGSCPAPGPKTARYGGNTSCVTVELSDGNVLILDAGTGLRELGQHLLAAERTSSIHLLLTHTHWDHILGLPFFAPLYRPDVRLRLHPPANAEQDRFRRQPALFDPIHFPVPVADIPAHIELVEHDTAPWQIGEAYVDTVLLNHPGGAQGFRIRCGGASVCYLTDNELRPPGAPTITPEELAAFAQGCDLLIHDAQYLSSDMPHKHGWGHSLIQDVLELGLLAKPRTLVLFHHDPSREDDTLDAIEAEARAFVASAGGQFAVYAAAEGQRFHLPRRSTEA